jgi:uncharacterized protein
LRAFSRKLNHLEQYIIPFGGLKPGHHAFDFVVDNVFFDQFEHTEIKSGTVAVHVDMEREERMMVLDFTIFGKVTLPCDRCLEPLKIAIEGKEKLVVKLGDHYEEESELVEIIPETDKLFDISSYLYEYLHLLLPAKRVHPDDENGQSTCDPAVMNKLKELDEQHVPDPRWEALNKLKNKS